MDSLGKTVLDADIIIKLSQSVFDKTGKTLLERFLELKGQYYIHQQVYQEVFFPEETKIMLDKLIDEGKILVRNDEHLLELFLILPHRYFLQCLKSCCEIFGSTYYDTYYKYLEDFVGRDRDIFVQELHLIESKIVQELGRGNNLGEIKSAVLAQCYFYAGQERVNYFASEDSRARNSMAMYYTDIHEIRCISLLAVFYLIRREGVSLEDVRTCADNLTIPAFKVDSRNGYVKYDIQEIVEKLYKQEFILLKNGMLRLK